MRHRNVPSRGQWCFLRLLFGTGTPLLCLLSIQALGRPLRYVHVCTARDCCCRPIVSLALRLHPSTNPSGSNVFIKSYHTEGSLDLYIERMPFFFLFISVIIDDNILLIAHTLIQLVRDSFHHQSPARDFAHAQQAKSVPLQASTQIYPPIHTHHAKKAHANLRKCMHICEVLSNIRMQPKHTSNAYTYHMHTYLTYHMHDGASSVRDSSHICSIVFERVRNELARGVG